MAILEIIYCQFMCGTVEPPEIFLRGGQVGPLKFLEWYYAAVLYRLDRITYWYTVNMPPRDLNLQWQRCSILYLCAGIIELRYVGDVQ